MASTQRRLNINSLGVPYDPEASTCHLFARDNDHEEIGRSKSVGASVTPLVIQSGTSRNTSVNNVEPTLAVKQSFSHRSKEGSLISHSDNNRHHLVTKINRVVEQVRGRARSSRDRGAFAIDGANDNLGMMEDADDNQPNSPGSLFVDESSSSGPGRGSRGIPVGSRVTVRGRGGRPRYVNKMPDSFRVSKETTPVVPTPRISDASLLKRNLTRAGADAAGKRSIGANDPENIQIVDMYDNQKLDWNKITEILNQQRVATGRNPTFTANGIHNRYNRNAPLLYAAEGKSFIPISERKDVAAVDSIWNDEYDKILIEVTKEVDASKWRQVATKFNSRTGEEIDHAVAAHRFNLI